MKKTSLLLFSLISLYSCQNSNAPQDSIDVLMSEMTIEEKVGQTCQITLDAILVRDSAGSVVEPHVIDEVKLQEAIFLMSRNTEKFGMGVVVDNSDKFLGIITLGDLSKIIKKDPMLLEENLEKYYN